jgi:Flp pilus assembly protein TadD
MSLLLDALKKAAQDKQKAKDLDKEGIQSPAKGEDEAMEAENIMESPMERPIESPVETPIESTEGEEALTLEEQAFDNQHEVVGSEVDFKEPGDDLGDDHGDAGSDDSGDDSEFTVDPPFELENKGATTTTVSDEALQLLIYKTNKDYRRSQKVLWVGLLSAAMALLIAGGFYYYNGMLEEVEALERKHKIAMRSVKEQPINKYTPPQPVNKSSVTQQVQSESKEMQSTKSSVNKKVLSATEQDQKETNRSAKSVFSVQKNEKRDPVGDLLNKAWQAYTEEDYTTASWAYNQVLDREPLNRDAWMGEAAIAVKQGQFERARAAYSRLLKLDPRDEIATAGLANLDETKPDTLNESKLKFMLKQQPGAAHLHFALGNFYSRQSKWPEAQSSYFSAWQGDSGNADYAFNLAVSLDHIGKQEEAVRFYRICLELASEQNISFSVQTVNDRLSRDVRR